KQPVHYGGQSTMLLLQFLSLTVRLSTRPAAIARLLWPWFSRTTVPPAQNTCLKTNRLSAPAAHTTPPIPPSLFTTTTGPSGSFMARYLSPESHPFHTLRKVQKCRT